MEILKHKNTIYEIKCSLYMFNSAMDMREERQGSWRHANRNHPI